MRTLFVLPALLVLTAVFGGAALVARALGLPDGPGTIYDRAPRLWARSILALSGVTVTVHNAERGGGGAPRVFVSNHVSWYDVLALLAVLPRYSFVAKAEIFRVPLFGSAARAVGTVPIERDNRKAAFASYDHAAELIRGGRSVVVYPEGTRGRTYALRPFKKGPFVLAVAAGVPVVPTLVHGTIEVLPRGSLWLRPRRIDVHLLDPVDASGLAYGDRDRLSAAVYERIAGALREVYGVESPPYRSVGVDRAREGASVTPARA